MILCTAFTPDYTLGDAYEASLREHCNLEYRVFSVGSKAPGRHYVPDNSNPHKMLQHGEFLQYLDDIWDDEVVIFTDADLLMQRQFTDEEIAFLEGFKPGQIGCGINQFYGATLDIEFDMLKPIQTKDELELSMPGFRTQRIWNTGFIVAQKSTYQRLYEEFLKLRPAIDACFLWHPRFQFALSYLIGTQFEHVDIPLSMHAHGHCGWPAGVRGQDGVLMFYDEAICMRHKI